MNKFIRGKTRSTGYTLLEMIVVVALLATIAAFSWPSVRASLENYRLRDAAKRVRAELGRARLKAMESGTPQQFRYRMGKGEFEVAPAKTGEAAADEAESRSLDPPVDGRTEELPDGVCFEEVPLDRSSPAQDESSSSSLDEEDDAANWSEPIVFLPNGRCSDAQIRLSDEREVHVDVTLRGLTGTVTAGAPKKEDMRR